MKIANDNHVVMVDDNSADIFLAKECFGLSKLKNPWLAFTTGPAFLEYLAKVKAGSAPMPGIVLLDINMPQMSGHEVLAKVRADDQFASLPIFCMLTSSSDPRDRERAEGAGASGFVIKPDDPDDYVRFFDTLAD